jgi:lipid II:glycine glycyltransferase (peptidoglycan interpeptide bridge formation enzyme)
MITKIAPINTEDKKLALKQFTDFIEFKESGYHPAYINFINGHPNGNYYQSADFFSLCHQTREYKPILLIALNNKNEIVGSLLGTIQTNGSGFKSWFSRRLIVWGGPLVGNEDTEICNLLLSSLKTYAAPNAIFIEFRNLFDSTIHRSTFKACGFEYQPYLNYLVKTDNEVDVFKRMQGNRRREINKSLKTGAIIKEATSKTEIMEFYLILKQLYKERVKKPLPEFDFFLKFRESDSGKVFLITFSGKIIGGALCPIFNNKIIYDWFHCGVKNVIPGVFAGVLAAWSPIDYGLKHGYKHLDFMGGGRPDEPYGVRDFKARYGAEKVSYGRYQLILNKSLYKVAQFGMQVYQKKIKLI